MNIRTLLKVASFGIVAMLFSISFSSYAVSYIKSAKVAYHHNHAQLHHNVKKSRKVSAMCRQFVHETLTERGYSTSLLHPNMSRHEMDSYKKYLQESNDLQNECHDSNGYSLYINDRDYYSKELTKFKNRVGAAGARYL